MARAATPTTHKNRNATPKPLLYLKRRESGQCAVRQRGRVSYSGAAAGMPAMITTNATANQSISDGDMKKSCMAYPLQG
jgi:hypothetical protein